MSGIGSWSSTNVRRQRQILFGILTRIMFAAGGKLAHMRGQLCGA